MATKTTSPSPAEIRAALGGSLPPAVNLLLDAPDCEPLIEAAERWREARAARSEARDALGVVETEVGVTAQRLREKPALRDRFARADLDRLHDLTVAVHAADRAEQHARGVVDFAAAALIDLPETRRWLTGLLRDIADQYQAALDGFVSAENDLMVIASAINATADRRIKQESLALDSGEYRRLPGDNYRQAKRLAAALGGDA